MKNIILDCDPGHDDAVAIMLAGNAENINLLGITVVAGNQTLEKTTTNAVNVSCYLGLDTKVYAGSAEPMVKSKHLVEQDIAGGIHGESGLDGPVFENITKKKEEQNAILYIIDILMNSEAKITLVATGPLTNIAMALRLEPKIKEHIEQIVLMGGAYQLGNVTPAAEFNIYADADAAHVVFTSGIEVVMVGLDVTRKVLCYNDIVTRMSKVGGKAAKLFEELMVVFNRNQNLVFGWEGAPLHDPLTIAYLIDNSVLTLKPMYTEIDIRSEQSYGRTNCDFFNCSKNAPNSLVAVDVDVEKFWDIVENSIKGYR